jgi:hypothetical protein
MSTLMSTPMSTPLTTDALGKHFPKVSYMLLNDIVTSLKFGGAGTTELAIKILCERFDTDERFDCIRRSMFLEILKYFRGRLQELRDQEQAVVPELKPEPIRAVVPELKPKPAQLLPIMVYYRPQQWTQGGYGPNRMKPV